MLKVNVSNFSRSVLYDPSKISKTEEYFIPTEINVSLVKYFQRREYKTCRFSGSSEKRILIYFSDSCEYISYTDCYKYVKEKVKDFVEYIDDCNDELVLINPRMCASIEKYDDKILIRFTDGDYIIVKRR